VLITRDMVEHMAAGSLVMDIAGAGGNCELTRPGETVLHGGVTIFGPTNLAADVPFHASQMFARNLATFCHAPAQGWKIPGWTRATKITRETLVTRGGQVVHPGAPKHSSSLPLTELPILHSNSRWEVEQARGDCRSALPCPARIFDADRERIFGSVVWGPLRRAQTPSNKAVTLCKRSIDAAATWRLEVNPAVRGTGAEEMSLSASVRQLLNQVIAKRVRRHPRRGQLGPTANARRCRRGNVRS